MSKPFDGARRAFLQRAAALSSLGAAATPLALNLAALGTASAQSAGDYKALVCIFLSGGNDSFNMVLPTDTASWSAYTSVRNQAPDPIALRAPGVAASASAAVGSPDRLGGVLPIEPADPQGRSFALHPLMGGARDLFAAGRLGVLANVGPLVRPMTKADYGNLAFPRPASLFSHNDQQSTWQTLSPEGSTAGWGGRMGDLLVSGNGNATFTSISAAGNAVWLAGRSVLQYQVSTSGAMRIGGQGATTLFGSAVAMERMRSVMRTARSADLLALDQAAITGRSIDAEQLVSASLPRADQAPYDVAGATASASHSLLQYDTVGGTRALNPLAQQLQIVARMIGARTALGARRQVFFVNLGGFDTHDAQNRLHADLMARLSHALAYFDGVLGAMGLRESVTAFTASDFGRTFTSNGDGTDHGWGAHHLVMGGAVRGRNVYGSFPQFGLPDGKGGFTSPDQLANGALLPQVSVEQLGATLGRWFGLSDGQLLDVFPNLAHFDASRRNLGFLG
ncbi:DUF1501 domain-containing protein [Aquincola sp. MAHUQ-54]|uniref:DUF1501 domain-containing protein n=1 Tax=Aquincola agrisoli TaxID=3119538 RepID=A0AAW9QDF8_9BURK